MIFEKMGLKPIAAPTNHMSLESKSLNSYISATNLRKVELAFHEYLGILWGKIKGFI